MLIAQSRVSSSSSSRIISDYIVRSPSKSRHWMKMNRETTMYVLPSLINWNLQSANLQSSYATWTSYCTRPNTLVLDYFIEAIRRRCCTVILSIRSFSFVYTYRSTLKYNLVSVMASSYFHDCCSYVNGYPWPLYAVPAYLKQLYTPL